LGNVRFAVVGRSTARKLFDYGYQADFVPSDFRSATLEQEWGRFRKKGEKILLVGGKSSLFRIRESLEQQGCTTETAVLYETVVDRRRKEELNRIFRDMDYVTLASGSAAKALAEMLEEISLNSRGEREAKIVVIGPETAEVCCRLGISVDFTAEEHTGRGIVQTVVSHVLE
jgi:uroporphyrinogen III methyltransferase/synthase